MTLTSKFATARRVGNSAIPVIDVSAAVRGQNLDGVAAQIHKAATDVGFFYISGHGIEQALIDQAFAVTRAFFAEPASVKQSVEVNTQQRGWMATGMSRLAGSQTHDLKEVFFWGTEVAPDDADLIAGKPLVAENQWPDAAFPRLKDELLPYYDAVCHVAGKVLAAIAVSLGQPADFFDARYNNPLARGQLVYYPPSTSAHEAEQRFGAAPHTDFGVLTFLLQDNNGGLQIRHKSGDWIEAPPLPGTLVCNIGDLLQRWTNDRFTSTLHRVINRSGNERHSIPVFFDPHTDTIIDPCDLGIASTASRYPPIKTGDYIMGRNRQSFSQYKPAP